MEVVGVAGNGRELAEAVVSSKRSVLKSLDLFSIPASGLPGGAVSSVPPATPPPTHLSDMTTMSSPSSVPLFCLGFSDVVGVAGDGRAEAETLRSSAGQYRVLCSLSPASVLKSERKQLPQIMDSPTALSSSFSSSSSLSLPRLKRREGSTGEGGASTESPRSSVELPFLTCLSAFSVALLLLSLIVYAQVAKFTSICMLSFKKRTCHTLRR